MTNADAAELVREHHIDEWTTVRIYRRASRLAPYFAREATSGHEGDVLADGHDIDGTVGRALALVAGRRGVAEQVEALSDAGVVADMTGTREPGMWRSLAGQRPASDSDDNASAARSRRS